jgi:predicted dehydrogenase
MEKVRFGIIGVGNMGSSHAKKFLGGEVKNGVLTAICDLKKSKTDAVLALENAPADLAVFTDYKEMLASGLIDAVIVAVPHYFHPEMTIAALNAGIHAICEKPAGVYTKQVKEMNEVAAKSDKLFSMMFNQRTNCVYRKMREIVQAGGIGELQRVTWIITDWYRTQQYYDSGSWRATWEGEGGGVLFNQCPHQIDLVQWVVGELPVQVNGFCQYGKWHDIEVEDDVTAYFRYKNGATGMFITTTGEAPGTNRFEISGTKGKLLVENNKLYYWQNEQDSQEWSKTATIGFVPPKCTMTEVETDGENPQHMGIINNFIAAIRGEEPLFVDGKEGINGVELMNAMELSGWNNGEPIMLPVDEDRYLRELEQHVANSKKKTCVDGAIADTAGTFGSK